MSFVVLSAFDTYLINPILNALIVMSNAMFGNFGLAIIALTIGIRLVTYPLTVKQLKTTRAMQEMQPRIQEIQKKYKDPKRRQQEMMKVYKEVGFNPLGCAVPFLIQIPIWIALFQVIRRTMGSTPEKLLELQGRLYDWDYITAAVPIDRNFFLLDLSNPSIPLAVLVAVATFYQQKFSTHRSKAKDDRQAATNKTLLYMMPLMFGWFTITVPSGLGLYWLTTSIFTIIMAYLYHKPKGLSWGWLVSMEALPPRAPTGAEVSLASAAAGQSSETAASHDDAPSDGDGTASPSKRRRRRRRRRRRPGASASREGVD